MKQATVGMAELVQHWTVLGAEKDLVSGKRGATRLGFALILKFYTRHGRFPHEHVGRGVHGPRPPSPPAPRLGKWTG